MELRAFGKTGLKVSVLGHGAAEVGYAGAGDDKVRALVDSALEAGVNVIDTAECYGSSEETLGRALSGRREKVLLFSKCGHSRGYGTPDWDEPDVLEKSLDRTLRLLKTDRLELF